MIWRLFSCIQDDSLPVLENRNAHARKIGWPASLQKKRKCRNGSLPLKRSSGEALKSLVASRQKTANRPAGCGPRVLNLAQNVSISRVFWVFSDTFRDDPTAVHFGRGSSSPILRQKKAKDGAPGTRPAFGADERVTGPCRQPHREVHSTMRDRCRHLGGDRA